MRALRVPQATGHASPVRAGGLSDAQRLTLTLLFLGAVVVAATTVLRGYAWKELGSYGDAPDYLLQARTFRPGPHHMPLYGWTVGALHLMTFRALPIEAVGLAVSFACLILTAHIIRALLRLEGVPPRRVFWIVLALSLFPARHFVYATRILADGMALLLAASGYLFLRRGRGHGANLCLFGAALTHDFAAVLWIPAAMDHLRRRAWGPLLCSPLIFLPPLGLILVRAFSPDGVSRLQYAGRAIFTLPLFGLLSPPFEQPWLNMGFYASTAAYASLYAYALLRSARKETRQAFWFSLVPFLVLVCLREYVLYYAFDRFLVFSFPVLASLLSEADLRGFRARAILTCYILLCLGSMAYLVWRFPSSDVRERFQPTAHHRTQAAVVVGTAENRQRFPQVPLPPHPLGLAYQHIQLFT